MARREGDVVRDGLVLVCDLEVDLASGFCFFEAGASSVGGRWSLELGDGSAESRGSG